MKKIITILLVYILILNNNIYPLGPRSNFKGNNSFAIEEVLFINDNTLLDYIKIFFYKDGANSSIDNNSINYKKYEKNKDKSIDEKHKIVLINCDYYIDIYKGPKPFLAELYYYRAGVYKKQKKYNLAIKDYKEVLKLKKDYKLAQDDLNSLLKELNEEKAKKEKQKEEKLRKEKEIKKINKRKREQRNKEKVKERFNEGMRKIEKEWQQKEEAAKEKIIEKNKQEKEKIAKQKEKEIKYKKEQKRQVKKSKKNKQKQKNKKISLKANNSKNTKNTHKNKTYIKSKKEKVTQEIVTQEIVTQEIVQKRMKKIRKNQKLKTKNGKKRLNKKMLKILKKGGVFFKDKQYEKADKKFNKIINKSKDNFEIASAYIGKIGIYTVKGNLKETLKMCDLAEERLLHCKTNKDIENKIKKVRGIKQETLKKIEENENEIKICQGKINKYQRFFWFYFIYDMVFFCKTERGHNLADKYYEKAKLHEMLDQDQAAIKEYKNAITYNPVFSLAYKGYQVIKISMAEKAKNESNFKLEKKYYIQIKEIFEKYKKNKQDQIKYWNLIMLGQAKEQCKGEIKHVSDYIKTIETKISEIDKLINEKKVLEKSV